MREGYLWNNEGGLFQSIFTRITISVRYRYFTVADFLVRFRKTVYVIRVRNFEFGEEIRRGKSPCSYIPSPNVLITFVIS